MIDRILGLVALSIALALCAKVVGGMYQRSVEQAEAARDAGDDEHYVVTIPSALGSLMLVNVGLAAAILAVNVFVWATGGKMGDGMVQFCLIYAGLFLLMYAGVRLWRITVDGDQMEIRRFLRHTRRARFSEVERVREDRWHQLVVYAHGHRLVTVNLLNDNRPRFDASLARAGVDMSAIPAADEVIRSVRAEQRRRGVPVPDDEETGEQ